VRNVCTSVHAKVRCAPLRIKKALGIFRELTKQQERQEEQLEWRFGTRFPGLKVKSRRKHNDRPLLYKEWPQK